MSNKYYNSYDEFEEKVSTPEELVANATQSLEQAKVDSKNQQQNKEEFTKVYNNIIKQGVDSMKKKNDTWDSIKDELYGVVKSLMVKYNISDITTLDKVKLGGVINPNKRKVVHMYFSNSIKKDREALANAEKAKKEKEERIKKANIDSYEAEKAKIEKEAKEKEAKASALNVSDDSKKVAEEIKSSKTAKTLTTALVGKSLPEVKLVQEILNSKGIDVGTADGKYGEKTKTGVMSYQKSKGLETDGVVGNNTWKSLLNIEEDLKMVTPEVNKKTSSSSKSTKSIYSDKEEKTLTSLGVTKGEDGQYSLTGDSLKGVLFESLGLILEAEEGVEKIDDKLKEYSSDTTVIVKPDYKLLVKYKDVEIGDFTYTISEEGKISVSSETKSKIADVIGEKTEVNLEEDAKLDDTFNYYNEDITKRDAKNKEDALRAYFKINPSDIAYFKWIAKEKGGTFEAVKTLFKDYIGEEYREFVSNLLNNTKADAKADAYLLYRAMEGAGTVEGIIYTVIKAREKEDNKYKKELQDFFEKEYGDGENLKQWLVDDLSDDEAETLFDIIDIKL